MKAFKVWCLVLIFGVTASGLAMAKDMKIAYVDLSHVFDNYQKTKEYDAILQKQGDAFKKQSDDMIQKIKDAEDKMALMKDSEKQKMQASIDKQKNDFLAFDKEKRADLTQKRDVKVKEILQDIEKDVGTIAKKEGYTFVLNDRVLVYGDKSLDITDQVLKTLNDSYKK